MDTVGLLITGVRFVAGHGWARLGRARPGKAWRGKARQGTYLIERGEHA